MSERAAAQVATEAAERLAELADLAELMDDTDGAEVLRRRSAAAVNQAMRLLDD